MQSPPITGIVRGPDGKPVAGINIVVKNSKKGVVSDANGSFSIDANAGDILVLSSIGYAQQEIKVSSLGLSLNIQLEVNNSPLDEVQVVAYGTTSQS